MWGQSDQFKDIVANVWQSPMYGLPVYQVVKKLKLLKHPLRQLNQGQFADIEVLAQKAQNSLLEKQLILQNKPNDRILIQEERDAAVLFEKFSTARTSFLAQKAKTQWVKEGDSNTSFFHCCIKARRKHNRVLEILDNRGDLCNTAETINKAFEDYYLTILGTNCSVVPVHQATVDLGMTVTEEHRRILSEPIQAQEVKEAIFDIPGSKAPGPDGFNSQFFKDAWDIIGPQTTQAVMDFFTHGKLLKQVNHTIITLIPKSSRPKSVVDFRPIACCNIMYKCIAKLLCSRLGKVLPDVISQNQSAFIKGRQIVENIFICQELVRLYGRKSCSPRALMKVDLRKAYDSLEWSFIHGMLNALKFPAHFTALIMECITTPTFSFALNGQQFGYLKGRRGLRQGDPMSPLLFTIAMEYLTRIHMVMSDHRDFKFHSLCRQMKLTHLCFVDDLLMFCRGDCQSVSLMLSAFETFSLASSLTMNKAKSQLFFNGTSPQTGNQLQLLTGMPQGSLPFKYLGVPISSRKLTVMDCEILIEKAVAQNRAWGARKLSYA
ncbi:hypothetical protein vseg_001879 [Gypsophila vaccaria]